MKAVQEYFIGITLPESLEKEVEKWRRKFDAPRTAPHITLIPPFKWGEGDQLLAETVWRVTDRHGTFPISGSGVGSFGKKVLFINVEPSPNLLAFQSDLAESLAGFGVPQERRPYHPHITLATRLTPNLFSVYRSLLDGYKPEFTFTFSGATIFELKRTENGQRWEIKK